MVAEFTAYQEAKFFTTDIIITSLLHDTIEDTSLTKETIAIIFDLEIARQVEALTRIKPHKKITSAEMLKLLYYNLEKKLLIIKLFDRFHNIQTLKVKTPEKAKKIIDETLEEFLILYVAQETAKLCKMYY
ncbi:HD domain protein [Rickettsia endosymbiont of Ixodes pacificus]|nr:HD domain protein [Rickettsia endosymbiont of Ixodes pacificus]